MNGVDVAALVLLGVSMLLGLFRGLVAQILSLLGWGVAYFASQWMAPHLVPWLDWGTLGPGAKLGLAVALGFVVVLLIWGLLSALVVHALRGTAMSGADRLLGAGFGLFRGVVIAALVVTVVQMTPLCHADVWRNANSVAWMQVVLEGLKPTLPASVAHYVGQGV